jgi:hypothetical protein
MTRFRIDKFVRYSTTITVALLMVSAPGILRRLDEPFRIDPPEGAREAVDGRASP